MQLEYYSPSSRPSHWITINEVISRERFDLTGLKPSTDYVVTVRARNSDGLSPPAPFSQPMWTASTGGDLDASAAVNREDAERAVREYLAADGVVKLVEATEVGPRKVNLKWEVRKRVINMVDQQQCISFE